MHTVSSIIEASIAKVGATSVKDMGKVSIKNKSIVEDDLRDIFVGTAD